jgi:hypothetical protein
MQKLALFLALLLGSISCANAQGTITLNGTEYKLQEPSGTIMAMVQNISNYSGITPNFKVWSAAGFDNAAALMPTYQGKRQRWIVYDPVFLTGLSEKAGTDWVRLAVLAHEIGHHTHAHYDLAAETPEANQEEELEADTFAGWVLGNMRASLVDGYKMYDLFDDPDDPSSGTHPTRVKRKAAFKVGWLRAQHTRGDTNPSTTIGNSCPIVILNGPNISSAEYRGTVGNKPATFYMGWGVDGTVSGRYTMEGKDQMYTLRGNRRNDTQIILDEYHGCIVTARLELAKSISGNVETVTGLMKNVDNSTLNVSVKRTINAPSAPRPQPSPTPTPTPQPGAGTKPKQWITTIGGFNDSWLVICGNGPSYTGQAYYMDKEFPSAWIKEKRGAGFHISHVAGDEGTWIAVATKGLPWGNQVVLGPGPLPETDYAYYYGQGYRITSVAGFDQTWVFVMTQGAGISDQRFSAPGPWPTAWIDKMTASGYLISKVCGDEGSSGSWLVVMNREYGQQVVSDSSTFPKDWIAARWNEGYRIIATSGYKDKWRIVMNKNSGLNQQSYWPVSSTFPKDFIKRKWDGVPEPASN